MWYPHRRPRLVAQRWDLWYVAHDEYETTFTEFRDVYDRREGPTHVLENDCGVYKFNGDTNFRIWCDICEADAAFLVTLFRIDLHPPRSNRFYSQFNRIDDVVYWNDSETYKFTVATHQINAISAKLTGDGSIAARVLKFLF